MKYATEIEEYYFPIQKIIKDILDLENNYYNIRPKKYIKKSPNNKYRLNLIVYK